MLLRHRKSDKCIYQQQTLRFIEQDCHRGQLKLISRLKKVQDSLHGRPDLKLCDFYLWGSLNLQFTKQMLTLWKN